MADIPDLATLWVFAALSAAFVITAVRLLRGPSLADRVVALDMLAYVLIGLATTAAIRSESTAYINVALGLGLFTFLGTITFARYLERQHMPEQDAQ